MSKFAVTPTQAICKTDTVGFVGFGNMAQGMVANLTAFLVANGCPPIVLFNRTESKLPPASALVVHAASLKDVALKCDVVFSSLGSDHGLRDTFDLLFEGAREKAKATSKGTIFVETSTVYPSLSGQLEREANLIPRTYYLQCPLFGPPPVAKSATLVWVVSGDHYAKKRVEPYMVPAMGKKILDVGSNVERAAAFKLTGNFLLLGILETLAEALTLADKCGVGADLLMEFVKEELPSPAYIRYGTRMQTSIFDGDSGFTVEGGLKDANHIRHLAASVNATVPLADLAHRNLITARALNGSDKDWSALVVGPRQAAGKDAWSGLERSPPRDSGFGQKEDFTTSTTEPVMSGPVSYVQNF